jgi:hypothetical protein
MMVLFGAAAAALGVRRKLATSKQAIAKRAA